MSLIPNSTNLAELTRVFSEIEARLGRQESKASGGAPASSASSGRTPATLAPVPPAGAADLTAIYAALKLLAPILNAHLEGVPTAPTAPTGTNTLQLATTAFMLAQLDVDPRLARKIPFTKADGTNTFLSGASGGIPFTKADGTLTTLPLVAA